MAALIINQISTVSTSNHGAFQLLTYKEEHGRLRHVKLCNVLATY